MGLFKKKTVTTIYDKENKKPAIKASICNVEQVTEYSQKKWIWVIGRIERISKGAFYKVS